MPNDADLLNIFWVEVSEYLESLNAALLQAETAKGGVGQAALREMNRVAHSMKGAARAVGIHTIETVAHHMENVFDSALHKKIELTPDVCDLLYDGLDFIQNVVDGEDANTDSVEDMLTRLDDVANGRVPDGLDLDALDDEEEQVDIPAVPKLSDEEADQLLFGFLPPKHSSKTMQVVKATNGDTPAPPEAPPPPPAVSPSKEVKRVQATLEIPAVNAPAEIPSTDEAATLTLRPLEETVRITVRKLDRLMAEASELLVAKMHGEERQRELLKLRRLHAGWGREWRSARTSYIRLARRMREESMGDEMATLFKFLETNQRLLTEANRQLSSLVQGITQDNLRLITLADQLQDDIAGMRLVPFESILGGFQRMIRDLARDTEKPVHFNISGAEVEFDKTVLDALKDPIMHILRNAVDHGIETPAERERIGKPGNGRVSMEVQQRGGEIQINITDDGRGIDPARIRRAAARSGLLNEQDALALSDEDARTLIFHPGLSTREQVTTISGRGVGMDIVRDRVENLRGRVSVQSTLGQGTTISMIVPVSLTRMRCIILQIAGESFAVPSAVVARMFILPKDQVFTAEGREMVLVDDRPTPLVSMQSILEVPSAPMTGPREQITVLALRSGERMLAFEVDSLSSERELVLKQLGPEIARARHVAGAALLGTGEVIIVLNAADLARSATGTSIPNRRHTSDIETVAKERVLHVLVVDDSITTRTLEKNILETAGFEVRTAIDGVEALQLLNEDEFDIIISDVEMPNMNGLELARRVKDSVHLKHIPLVLLTSLNKPEQREAGMRAGADAYLVKSRFDQGELLRTIRILV